MENPEDSMSVEDDDDVKEGLAILLELLAENSKTDETDGKCDAPPLPLDAPSTSGTSRSAVDETILYPDDYEDKPRPRNVLIIDVMKANECEDKYVYEYLGSRFNMVRMVGTVIDLDEREDQLIITIDDGTAVIKCFVTKDNEYQMCLKEAQNFINDSESIENEELAPMYPIVKRRVKSLVRELPYTKIFQPMNIVGMGRSALAFCHLDVLGMTGDYRDIDTLDSLNV